MFASVYFLHRNKIAHFKKVGILMTTKQVCTPADNYNGPTLVILRGLKTCHRYQGIKSWLSTHKPEIPVKELDLRSKEGVEMWGDLRRRFNITSLPQVVVITGNRPTHLGELDEIKFFFGYEEKESCPC